MNASLKRAMAWGLLRSGALSLHRSGFERHRAVILVYHRINDDRDPFFPSTPVEEFSQQLEYLARRYRLEPFDAVADWLEQGGQGRPRLAITIDDGYRDTHDAVLPELERLGVPATLFLSTAPPETGRPLWTDRVRAVFKQARAASVDLPPLGLGGLDLSTEGARLSSLARAMRALKRSAPARITAVLASLEERLGRPDPWPAVLDWEDVRRLARRVSLGAHTHNHYILSGLDDAELFSEIETSVRLIRERTGVAVSTFAYPNGEAGDYDPRAIDVLRQLGLKAAVTCRLGFARAGDRRHELPRVHARESFLPVFATRVAGLSREIRQADR